MKAVIYARFSSEKQNEASIEGQLRECLEYANFNGIEVIGNYIDRAQSAKTDHRPEFQRMIKDSYKRPFDCILVWKLDRFARNRYDSAYYKNILKKNGVRVISAKESISQGADGILLEAILEGYAEFYSAELSEKVKRGMTEKATVCALHSAIMWTIPTIIRSTKRLRLSYERSSPAISTGGASTISSSYSTSEASSTKASR